MKEILRRILIILPALASGLILSYWLFRVELAEAVSLPEPEVVVQEVLPITVPAYETAVFSRSDDTDLSICWDNYSYSHRLEAELYDAIRAVTADGHDLSFLLYDLNTGNGIRYRSTEGHYCASTIKGPYVACIAETLPDCISRSGAVMEETIQVSDNDGYRSLRRRYGTSAFRTWTEEAGCTYLNPYSLWPEITAHDLALMWVQMRSYFTSDAEEAAWTAELYIDTLNSFLSDALGSTYTVYSKAGWIDSDGYYTARNDAGIVEKEGHPYVLVVLSDLYDEDELLCNLVCTLDAAHTWLISHS